MTGGNLAEVRCPWPWRPVNLLRYYLPNSFIINDGGQRWIRTIVDLRQQIYSPYKGLIISHFRHHSTSLRDFLQAGILPTMQRIAVCREVSVRNCQKQDRIPPESVAICASHVSRSIDWCRRLRL